MKRKTMYLDRRHNRAPPDTASWKVMIEEDDQGETTYEAWTDLEAERANPSRPPQ